jgi:hypothetical protein
LDLSLKINGLAVIVQANRGISDGPIAEGQNQSREETNMAGKIAALLNMLTLSDVEAMAPIDRRSFAERCRFWAHLVERTRIDSLDSGVLAELRHGYRVD